MDFYPPFYGTGHQMPDTITQQGIYNFDSQAACLNQLFLMPSPSASSKFVLSVLKFLGILKFLSYTQNILGVLKWANLCSKI